MMNRGPAHGSFRQVLILVSDHAVDRFSASGERSLSGAEDAVRRGGRGTNVRDRLACQWLLWGETRLLDTLCNEFLQAPQTAIVNTVLFEMGDRVVQILGT